MLGSTNQNFEGLSKNSGTTDRKSNCLAKRARCNRLSEHIWNFQEHSRGYVKDPADSTACIPSYLHKPFPGIRCTTQGPLQKSPFFLDRSNPEPRGELPLINFQANQGLAWLLLLWWESSCLSGDDRSLSETKRWRHTRELDSARGYCEDPGAHSWKILQ